MPWIVLSLVFFWLAYREIRNSRVAPPGYSFPAPLSWPFLLIVLGLGIAFASPPLHTWRLERFLSAKATLIADNRPARVHCNTVFETMLDQHVFAAAHADPATGRIVIQYPWCRTLSGYLAHPQRADRLEIASLNLITHESMHVRGERDEAVTECQAVQRNYRAAQLLGVPAAIAKRNALAYYFGDYRQREQIGGLAGAYFSAQCAPDKGLDEYLPDSTWR